MYTSEKYCKNCLQHLLLDQKYCHGCGQNADTHRIDFHFLLHEVQHSIFHVDKGILFTLKNLFTRPGHMLREYLEGRRQGQFKPVLMLIIIGSICGLLNHFLSEPEQIDFRQFDSKANNSKLSNYLDVSGFAHFLYDVAMWFANHLAFTILMMIPVTALGFYLGFRKYGIYYTEWLIVFCYLSAQSLAVYLLVIPLEYIFDRNFIFWYFAASMGLIFWGLIQFFHKKNSLKVSLRTAWSFALSYFFGFIYLLIAVIIIVVAGFTMYGNEEMLNNI